MPHPVRPLTMALVLLLLSVSTSARAQSTIVLFDENDVAGADYRDASYGVARDGDFLRLAGPNESRLPVEDAHAFSGATSGLLEGQHVTGGRWEMNIEHEEAHTQRFDLTGYDSLIVYLNGPEAIPGAELPRFSLRDVGGMPSPPVWLSTPRNVRVDTQQSGFTAESPTNVVLATSYRTVLPSTQRRIGYPEDLVVTFADVPLDTSQAAIGAPAIPAHFTVTTEATGRRLDFSFRDLDGDHTLSAEGEFIDVLLPEREGAAQLRATWRIEVAQAPDPIAPPGEGDVYRLVLAFDAFALDADPDTWQRLSIPLIDLLTSELFVADQVTGVQFRNGGANPEVRTLWVDRITAIQNDDEAFLDEVQRATFDFFWNETNPANGLVKDRSTGSVSSIAAVGFGLSAYTVGIDRGWITRRQGITRVLNTLEFFRSCPQGTGTSDVCGHRGFFYHFLDMQTGRRAGTTELSTVDTALLLGGVLHVRMYFDGSSDDEVRIRELADAIYERVEWDWAQVRPPAISHGWRPESGFIGNDWIGYNEAMIVYILALGSPTHPVGPDAWDRWVSGYGGQWQTQFGYTFLTFPPLFGHQYSHVWIDFRGIQDAYMRERGIDYFENSRRATLAQRAYHIANPRGWPNYSRDEWGLTASDTPDGYRARGAPPPQNDDGTLVPTAPGGSIVFTPEESIAALRHMRASYPRLWGPYGFRDAYNVSRNWFDVAYLGIDQGPILLMIENLRTEAVWARFMQHEAIQRGLDRAGFRPTDTGVERGAGPNGLVLHGNVPNPFREHTKIHYELPRPGHVRLTVYDLLGRAVATLVDEVQAARVHQVAFDARGRPSGVYFYRLEHGGAIRTGQGIHVR